MLAADSVLRAFSIDFVRGVAERYHHYLDGSHNSLVIDAWLSHKHGSCGRRSQPIGYRVPQAIRGPEAGTAPKRRNDLAQQLGAHLR